MTEELKELLGLAILFTQTIAVPWAVWVTRKIYSLDKALSLNSQNDIATQRELQTMNTRLDELVKLTQQMLIALAGKGIKVDKE